MNSFLIPANAKKGTLILNLFRPIDLAIFGTGILISFILLTIFQSNSSGMIILISLPAAITGILVFPIPNYHNVLCTLQSIIGFFTERRKYIWKGWCFYERIIEENEKASGKK